MALAFSGASTPPQQTGETNRRLLLTATTRACTKTNAIEYTHLRQPRSHKQGAGCQQIDVADVQDDAVAGASGPWSKKKLREFQLWRIWLVRFGVEHC